MKAGRTQFKGLEKENFYFEHIKGWQESGLSQEQYCKKHGVKLTTLMYWRKKYLENKEKDQGQDNSFTQIKIKELPKGNLTTIQKYSAGSLTIILPNRIELVLPMATESQFITNLIQSLSGALC